LFFVVGDDKNFRTVQDKTNRLCDPTKNFSYEGRMATEDKAAKNLKQYTHTGAAFSGLVLQILALTLDGQSIKSQQRMLNPMIAEHNATTDRLRRLDVAAIQQPPEKKTRVDAM
jgi:hypothetical protein